MASQSLRSAVLQLLPAVSSLVHEHACEVLDEGVSLLELAIGQLAPPLWPSYAVRHSQLGMIVTFVTAHCDEGGLRTEDRHVSERISHVGTARERACLCGVRRGELLLTFDHRLLAGNVKG